MGFQSTHPRGVRPGWSWLGIMPWDVSIHAPAWGATFWAMFCSAPYPMFQSTHPRGVRRRRCLCYGYRGPCFNPRTRVGCDRADILPVKARPGFQSTHPRGVRLADDTVRALIAEFQSTHPRGVRPGPETSAFTLSASFNPRTRVGCDLLRVYQHTRYRLVSIHAPAWGATVRMVLMDAISQVSIHAPAWGATGS